MNKFQLFLQQANFKDDVLQTASLNVVRVNVPRKSWTFEIEFAVNPTINNLNSFVENLEIYFSNKDIVNKVDYNISVKDDSLLKELALDYYNWILDKLINKRSSYSVYKTYETEYLQNQIVIHLDAETIKKTKMKKIVDPLLKKHGLNCQLKLEVDEDLLTDRKSVV